MGSASQAGLVQRRVFLNVPYDAGYEQNFLALISALISIGRIPRCAAEDPVLGRNRLDRIFKLLKGCKVSIHDLCRVTLPPRFNIPFELGIAYALSKDANSGNDSIIRRLDEQCRNLSSEQGLAATEALRARLSCDVDVSSKHRRCNGCNRMRNLAVNFRVLFRRS